MITADEAREKTKKSRKSTDELLRIIESMACYGNDYATVRTCEIQDHVQSKTDLEAMGFLVTNDGTFFNIKW